MRNPLVPTYNLVVNDRREAVICKSRFAYVLCFLLFPLLHLLLFLGASVHLFPPLAPNATPSFVMLDSLSIILIGVCSTGTPGGFPEILWRYKVVAVPRPEEVQRLLPKLSMKEGLPPSRLTEAVMASMVPFDYRRPQLMSAGTGDANTLLKNFVKAYGPLKDNFLVKEAARRSSEEYKSHVASFSRELAEGEIAVRRAWR